MNHLEKPDFAELSQEEPEILKEAEEKLNSKRKENKLFLLALNESESPGSYWSQGILIS